MIDEEEENLLKSLQKACATMKEETQKLNELCYSNTLNQSGDDNILPNVNTNLLLEEEHSNLNIMKSLHEVASMHLRQLDEAVTNKNPALNITEENSELKEDFVQINVTASKPGCHFDTNKNIKGSYFLEERKQLKEFDVCKVVYAASPSEFYLLTSEDFEVLNSIGQFLSNYYKHTGLGEGLARKDHLRPCGKYFTTMIDCKWYRIEVIDWFLSRMDKSDSVYVKLVDCGRKVIVYVNNLLPMPEAVSEYPKLAYRCHFSYLYPPGTKRSAQWSENTIKYFHSLLGNLDSTLFVVQHCCYSIRRKSYEVDICKALDYNPQTIGQILINAGAVVIKIDNLPIPKLKYTEILNYLQKNYVDSAVAPSIPNFEPFVKRCYMDLLGKIIIVKVTHVEDMPFFYVQEHRETTYGCYEPSPDSLMESLNKDETIADYKNLPRLPEKNEIVLAKTDKGWYRAKVKAVQLQPQYFNSVEVKVHLFDFGNSVIVPLHNIREIPQELLYIDYQAIMCKLYKITSKKYVKCQLTHTAFSKYCLGYTFQARVMDLKQNYLELILIDNDGIDIGKQLITDGYADFEAESN